MNRLICFIYVTELINFMANGALALHSKSMVMLSALATVHPLS